MEHQPLEDLLKYRLLALASEILVILIHPAELRPRIFISYLFPDVADVTDDTINDNDYDDETLSLTRLRESLLLKNHACYNRNYSSKKRNE